MGYKDHSGRDVRILVMDGGLAQATGIGVQWSACSEYLVGQGSNRNKGNSRQCTISDRAAVSKSRERLN